MRALALTLALAACSNDTNERSAATRLVEAADPRLAIKPKGQAAPMAPADPCDGLELRLEADAQTLRKGAPAPSLERRHDGTLDPAWLEHELHAAKPAGCTAIQIVVAGAQYQQVIAATDVCIKVGLPDVGLE